MRTQERACGVHLQATAPRAETRRMALIEVKVPDIGDFDQVEVIEVLVKVGDTIKANKAW